MFQKILVAIDHSEISRLGFEKAIELAKLNHAEVMLIHIVSAVSEGLPTPLYSMPDSVYPLQQEAMIRASAQSFSQAEEAGLDLLRSRNATAMAAGIRCKFAQHIGDPGEVICTVAKTWNADLIVLGRRGRSGLSEFFLGSVSNEVMHHAPCSVLIVQEPLETVDLPVKD
jgi:nucleotide-binding universal stress UspA family protein